MTYMPNAAHTAASAVPSPALIHIALVNESTAITDTEARTAMAAVALQVTRDFAPIWGVSAQLTFYASAEKAKIPPSAWWMVLLDDTNQQDALGYHSLSPTNQPMGRVFVRTALQNNLSWTVTLSHETLEALGNPWVNAFVFIQDNDTTGIIIPREVSDPVEDAACGYKINETLVSDFVTPAWFQLQRAQGAVYDFTKHCTVPLEVAPGGYMQTFSVTGGGWKQVGADTDGDDDDAKPAERVYAGGRASFAT